MDKLPAELISKVAEDLDKRRQRVFCLTCKHINEIASKVLWRNVVVSDLKVEGFLEVLDSLKIVGWVRELIVREERKSRPEIVLLKRAPGELNALFAKVLRKMPILKVLEVHTPILCGPAVVAELCAREDSVLRTLHMKIGTVEDTDDFSGLSDLKLRTGKLQSIYLEGGKQAEYPQLFVDAISRIIQASAGSITHLNICETQHVHQFFVGVDRFPMLEELVIRDTDLIPRPCFLSESDRRQIYSLQVVCDGHALDGDTANRVARYFEAVYVFTLLLEKTYYEVSLFFCT